MKISLEKKLFFVSIVPLIAGFICLAIVNYMINNLAKQSAMQILTSEIEKKDIELRNLFYLSIAEVNALSEEVSLLMEKDVLTRNTAAVIAENYIERSGFFGGAIIFEPNILGKDADFVGTRYHDNKGRFIPYWYLENGKLEQEILTAFDGEEWFEVPKSSKKTVLTEPYWYEAGGEQYLMVTAAAPIFYMGQVIGVNTYDFLLTKFQEFVEGIKPFKTGGAVLISDNGVVIASPDKAFANQPASKLPGFPQNELSAALKKAIGGERAIFRWTDKKMGEAVSIAVPVKVERVDKIWVLLVTSYNESVFAETGLDNLELIFYFLFGSIIVAVFGITAFSRVFIIRYLRIFMEAFRDVTEGEGDLTKTISIKSGDEFESLAEQLNGFVIRLSYIVKDIKASADRSAENAGDIGKNLQGLQNSFSQQSSDISSVTAALDQVVVASKQVAATIRDNEAIVGSTAAQIIEGERSLTSLYSSMERINAITISLSGTVSKLGDASAQIGDILNAINDIADQTNLLALNAAIEAARAGDAGRGFAVVADEVRKLAERTQKSTQEIKSIIIALQTETNRASEEMVVAEASVKESITIAESAKNSFQGVVTVVGTIDSNSKQITSSVEEQTTSLTEVNNSAQDISALLDACNQTIDLFNKSVKELTDASQNTKALLDRFKV
jgi:methyl-accepting chemotaxis protein